MRDRGKTPEFARRHAPIYAGIAFETAPLFRGTDDSNPVPSAGKTADESDSHEEPA
jgi:hypothetical protein